MRQDRFLDGQFEDSLIMSMLATEYREMKAARARP